MNTDQKAQLYKVSIQNTKAILLIARTQLKLLIWSSSVYEPLCRAIQQYYFCEA